MSVRILTGDCREVLQTLPAESVHCIVTSPPYYGLRDYGVDGQIGLEPSPDEWVAELVDVFRECRRVLRADGTAWVNLGDSYAAGGNGVGSGKQLTNVGSHMPAKKAPIGLKPKDLIGQPWMVAFALRADGWYLRSEIIWHKPNAMPESVRDRPTKGHEQVFLLTKSPSYYYDAAAIAEPASPDTHARYAAAKGKPFGMSNWARGEGPHDAVTHSRREVGIGHNARPRKGAPNGSGTKNNPSFDAAMAVMPDTRNSRTVWSIVSEPFSEAHFATFPTELPRRCILAGCPEGGTVLDPFGGAGTTGLVADRLQRDAILVELNPEYADMARRRITGDAPLFAEVA